MSEFAKKIGLPAGALVFGGKQQAEKVTMEIFDYNESQFSEDKVDVLPDCTKYVSPDSTSWMNIDGLHDAQLISNIGRKFSLHILLLEDLMNTSHRPKIEEFEGHMFLMLKMLSVRPDKAIEVEQVSIVFGKGWVLSFIEHPGDIFNPIRERIRHDKGGVRKRKNDYLVYLLLDIIVDNYFIVSDHFEALTDELEHEILENPTEDTMLRLQRLKKDVATIRKYIAPLREEVGTLAFNENEFIDPRSMKYYKDIYDHIIHLLETLDNLKDTINALLEMYHNALSARMNQVMKVLTVITVIFIPLTFIAGIYGMNFDPAAGPLMMPELKWKYGYVTVWITMAALVFAMLYFFRRKKWL